MNSKIGVDGGINQIRRMNISDFLNKPNITLEDKVAFANHSQHSLNTQTYYFFNQKSDDENDENNDN
jgi:hypothetical protein